MTLRRKVLGSAVDGGPMIEPPYGRRYERFECAGCNGGVDVMDNYCRWCGEALTTEPLAIVPRTGTA